MIWVFGAGCLIFSVGCLTAAAFVNARLRKCERTFLDLECKLFQHSKAIGKIREDASQDRIRFTVDRRKVIDRVSNIERQVRRDQ